MTFLPGSSTETLSLGSQCFELIVYTFFWSSFYFLAYFIPVPLELFYINWLFQNDFNMLDICLALHLWLIWEGHETIDDREDPRILNTHYFTTDDSGPEFNSEWFFLQDEPYIHLPPIRYNRILDILVDPYYSFLYFSSIIQIAILYNIFCFYGFSYIFTGFFTGLPVFFFPINVITVPILNLFIFDKVEDILTETMDDLGPNEFSHGLTEDSESPESLLNFEISSNGLSSFEKKKLHLNFFYYKLQHNSILPRQLLYHFNYNYDSISNLINIAFFYKITRLPLKYSFLKNQSTLKFVRQLPSFNIFFGKNSEMVTEFYEGFGDNLKKFPTFCGPSKLLCKRIASRWFRFYFIFDNKYYKRRWFSVPLYVHMLCSKNINIFITSLKKIIFTYRKRQSWSLIRKNLKEFLCVPRKKKLYINQLYLKLNTFSPSLKYKTSHRMLRFLTKNKSNLSHFKISPANFSTLNSKNWVHVLKTKPNTSKKMSDSFLDNNFNLLDSDESEDSSESEALDLAFLKKKILQPTFLQLNCFFPRYKQNFLSNIKSNFLSLQKSKSIFSILNTSRYLTNLHILSSLVFCLQRKISKKLLNIKNYLKLQKIPILKKIIRIIPNIVMLNNTISLYNIVSYQPKLLLDTENLPVILKRNSLEIDHIKYKTPEYFDSYLNENRVKIFLHKKSVPFRYVFLKKPKNAIKLLQLFTKTSLKLHQQFNKNLPFNITSTRPLISALSLFYNNKKKFLCSNNLRFFRLGLSRVSFSTVAASRYHSDSLLKLSISDINTKLRFSTSWPLNNSFKLRTLSNHNLKVPFSMHFTKYEPSVDEDSVIPLKEPGNSTSSDFKLKEEQRECFFYPFREQGVRLAFNSDLKFNRSRFENALLHKVLTPFLNITKRDKRKVRLQSFSNKNVLLSKYAFELQRTCSFIKLGFLQRSNFLKSYSKVHLGIFKKQNKLISFSRICNLYYPALKLNYFNYHFNSWSNKYGILEDAGISDENSISEVFQSKFPVLFSHIANRPKLGIRVTYPKDANLDSKNADKKDDGKGDASKKDGGKKDDGKGDAGKKDGVKKDDGKKDESKKGGGKKDEGKKDSDKKDEGQKAGGKKDEDKKDEGKKDEDNKDGDIKDPKKKKKKKKGIPPVLKSDVF